MTTTLRDAVFHAVAALVSLLIVAAAADRLHSIAPHSHDGGVSYHSHP